MVDMALPWKSDSVGMAFGIEMVGLMKLLLMVGLRVWEAVVLLDDMELMVM